MAGHVTPGSLAPAAQPSGLPPLQPRAICKRHLTAVLPAPETCPRNSLGMQPRPQPRAGAMEWPRAHASSHLPRGSWQEREFGKLLGLAAVSLSAVWMDAERVPIASSFCCTNPPGSWTGIFSSLSQKDLASQALAREIGMGLGSAWAAKNLEVTNSCCRNAGISWELWGASPGRCAPRAVAAPQHHRARFPKGKAMLERASVLI